MYVIFIRNRMARENLDWRTPYERLYGSTPDISMIYRFQFFEKIYYKREDASFPSDSNEAAGWFVGFSEHVGHTMTYKVLTQET